ncbi:MAG: DUF177 domain-containing protein [Bacteroidota bacterium]
MTSLKEFVIPYLGIKNGEHQFQFLLDKDFFSHFEMSKIVEADLQISVVFDRQDGMVNLHLRCTGSYRGDCDRCTAPIDIPLSFDDYVIIKLATPPEHVTDEVIYMPPESSHVDISDPIYQSVHLHMPIQQLRDCEGESYRHCDQDVLTKIGGIDTITDEDEQQQSSIWSELDKLNFNKE